MGKARSPTPSRPSERRVPEENPDHHRADVCRSRPGLDGWGLCPDGNVRTDGEAAER